MKIKRFCAPDIRQAMRLIREDLGADAVILSNRNIDDGVEIVAAMDFDQELFQNQAREVVGEPEKKDRVSHGSAPRNPAPAEPVAKVKSAPFANSQGSLPENAKSVDQAVVSRVTPGAQAILEYTAASNAAPKPAKSGSSVNVGSESQAGIEPVLDEMRKEFDQIRDLLNTRISEISWAESVRLNPVCREVFRQLNQLGFSDTICKKILKQIDVSSDFPSVWDKVRRSISQHLQVHDDNLLEYGGIVALVGPTGVGKTTTIAKLAAKFCLKYGARKIALVTADNYRIAAYEQLNTYGRILDIPVRTAHDNAELEKVLRELIDKRLILIDTAGVSQRDMRLADQFPVLHSKELPIHAYLVMSAATQYPTMKEIIQAFKVFEPYAGILTKLDETVTVAAAVSAFIENQLPVSFVCDGQKVPENLRTAKDYGLAGKCFAATSGKAFPFRSSNAGSEDQRVQAYG